MGQLYKFQQQEHKVTFDSQILESLIFNGPILVIFHLWGLDSSSVASSGDETRQKYQQL